MDQPGVADRYAFVNDPAVLDRLRHEFRRLNRSMVLLWRLGLGPVFGWFPRTVGRILVLHHVGRNSGRVFRSPVNYADVNGSLFCVAAFGGGTDWYRNVIATPFVEAWLPTGRWNVEVRDASERPDRLDLIRQVLISSGFAAPAFGLHPTKMSDEALRHATEDYRLLEIVPISELSDPVADLAWVWLALAALGVVVKRPRR